MPLWSMCKLYNHIYSHLVNNSTYTTLVLTVQRRNVSVSLLLDFNNIKICIHWNHKPRPMWEEIRYIISLCLTGVSLLFSLHHALFRCGRRWSLRHYRIQILQTRLPRPLRPSSSSCRTTFASTPIFASHLTVLFSGFMFLQWTIVHFQLTRYSVEYECDFCFCLIAYCNYGIFITLIF